MRWGLLCGWWFGTRHFHFDLHGAHLHRDIDELDSISEKLGLPSGLVSFFELADDFLNDRNCSLLGRLR